MQPSPQDRSIARWLLFVAAAVAAMVVIGGITRLTGSGLSMVEWRPLIGALPPVSQAEWQRVFELYQASPQYRTVNDWMGLADFQTIFWWEYLHRLWGRLIGAFFALPFLWFLVRGHIPRPMLPRLIGLFVLGGLQGLIGWWMVKSGLVSDPEVSQYRLTVHLSMAFLILGLLIWTALDLVMPHAGPPNEAATAKSSIWVLALISLTVIAGALVAGTDAGKAFNTFPLMDGSLIPAGYNELSPWWRNGLENIAAIQLHHRILAIVTLVVTVWFAWTTIRARGPASRPAHWLAIAVVVQVGLGISTLITAVPVTLGALHQAGAVALFTAAVWCAHAARW
jgi:cytochrome c oxidase assembly protein subunit 15